MSSSIEPERALPSTPVRGRTKFTSFLSWWRKFDSHSRELGAPASTIAVAKTYYDAGISPQFAVRHIKVVAS